MSAKKPALPANWPDLPESLVWAIVAVSVGGLAILIGLMAVMKNELHFENHLILIFSLLSFALLLGAESIFIWLLFSAGRRARRREKEAVETSQLRGSATKELAEPAHPLSEPVMSVTEQTTRTLEPVYRERKENSDY